jgi:indole-3-glycerol phosphate synthase
MTDIDVGAIVPSTRDLLQVLSTRRKSLALVARIDAETPSPAPAEEAARLYDINISAFAFSEPGEAMQLGARATKTVPSLSLLPVTDRNGCLRARYFGADGVCIDARMPADEWEKLAKGARTMRMLPLAYATDAESAQAAVKAGARAVLVKAGSADEIIAIAADLPRNITLLAEVTGGDEGALRRLARVADAAVVPPSVHTGAGFAGLVGELDP